MASKIKVPPQEEKMLENEGRETPLLDLSDAAVRELIRTAKKRGYVNVSRYSATISSQVSL
jgi:RNA polymerase primary sigma factor